jgi:hypothetical protein
MTMTADQPLRLTESASNPPDSYMLEHRVAPRHRVSGRVTCVQYEAGPDGAQHRIASLQLLNMSNAGVGALAQEPMALNSSVAVFFPPHGPERGFDLFGRVVRCIHRDNGHEIGIRLEARAAA